MISSTAAAGMGLGGKAGTLARLSSQFSVPAFMVVLPEDTPNQEDLAQALSGVSPSITWAVRSSAQDEDSETNSFAGQLESYLNVPIDTLAVHVQKVRDSAKSERIQQYLKERGLKEAGVPAVIVQEMIQADFAGVAFSVDPATSDPTWTVISAVAGLGDQLVSGEAEGQTYRVHSSGNLELPPESLLTKTQVQAVAKLCQDVAVWAGCPQDIEWAIEGGRLYLLQARPITTLEEATWWDNSNIIESYSGVTTPLTFSFASRAYGAVYRDFCRLLGVPEDTLRQESTTFDRMIGLVQGRVYYSLNSWYRVLALLPGFSLNRKFMETMMGVREGMPAEINLPPPKGRLEDALYLIRTVLGLIRAYIRLPHMQQWFYERLRILDATTSLKGKTLSQLMGYYRELEGKLLTKWDAPLVNDFFAMIFYGLLRRLSERWLGGAIHNDLIGGEGGIISTEPAERLQKMSEQIKALGLGELFRTGEWPQVQAALATHNLAGFEAYLDRFGDRCLNELKLESPTLRDNPLLLARTLGGLAQMEAVNHNPQATRGKAESAVEALTGWKAAVFNWVLRQARLRVRDRENLRFERTRVFGKARQIFRAAGEKLFQLGKLERPEDVFYLRVEELLAYSEGTAVSTDLAGLASIRKAEFADFAKAPTPPDRFRSVGSVYQTRFNATQTTLDSSTERQGTGCAPGVVQGPVRVVHDPTAVQISELIIIVAERTDPGWILILPLARALIVERGSLLSHSAIVSRELGIPSVVGLDNATQWLKDGDWVELDGQTGLVRKIEAPTRTPA
jgi:rifampicin phosphotransferase